jgi:hypothetical protein
LHVANTTILKIKKEEGLWPPAYMLTGALTVATVCVRILCSRLHVSITISTNVDILCARGQTMIEFGVNSAAWGILTGRNGGVLLCCFALFNWQKHPKGYLQKPRQPEHDMVASATQANLYFNSFFYSFM